MTTDFDAYERELWAGRAVAYERGFARLSGYTIDPLLDAAGVTEGSRVLDVGTGPGIVAAAASRRGARVSAVDADPGMAELAAAKVPEADVRVALLPELPFPDETFDAVVGNYVINHVGEPVTALVELRRLLRPGGRIALTTWVMPGSGALGFIRDAIAEAEVPWPDDIPVPPFMDYGQPEPYRGLLVEAGFADARVDEVDWDHVTDAEEWWEYGPMARIGSNGIVIARQDAGTVARIKQAYDRIIKGYATSTGQVALPAHALLASATR